MTQVKTIDEYRDINRYLKELDNDPNRTLVKITSVVMNNLIHHIVEYTIN